MEFESAYVSHEVDKQGLVDYSPGENHVWQILYDRQQKLLPGRACEAFFRGLEILDLTKNTVPQLPNVTENLNQATGWAVSPVAALISEKEFFELLASRHFPAATFIRTHEELNYVKEPDIFHELFGHCPMLTDSTFADFVADYAKMVLTFPREDWRLLQRVFWFTVEFGLINTPDGLRAYGGGILSSIEETVYSVDSDKPERKPFDIVDVLRTPYRIDMLQPIYYVIDSYQQLYDLVDDDLPGTIAKARELGEFEPTFPTDPDNPTMHINAC
jgi:phenylalanine-4-hydroxylase